MVAGWVTSKGGSGSEHGKKRQKKSGRRSKITAEDKSEGEHMRDERQTRLDCQNWDCICLRRITPAPLPGTATKKKRQICQEKKTGV